MAEITFYCKRMIRRILSFLPFVLVVAACYFTAEFYPLSSFPMYSKFDNRTYICYLRDADGNELPTVKSTGIYASELKKRYGDELKNLKKEQDYKGSHFDWTTERKAEAGSEALAYLKEFEKVPQNVELIDRRLYLRNGKIEFEESVVGKN